MSVRSRNPFSQARITRGCLYLLITTAVVYVLVTFLDEVTRLEFLQAVVATPKGVWQELRLWTLLTSWLVEGRFVQVLFSGFMLWMFMPALERWWGLKRFLVFAATTSVVGTVAGTLVGSWVDPNTPIAGLSPFVYAGIVAYGMLFARQRVQFFGVVPMTGKQLALGICGFVLVFTVFTGDWGNGSAYASAMLVAWTLTSDRARPRLRYLQWRQKRVRRHLKLVPKDSDKKWMN